MTGLLRVFSVLREFRFANNADNVDLRFDKRLKMSEQLDQEVLHISTLLIQVRITLCCCQV